MTSSPTLAATLALWSACGFAFSTSLQHLAAGRVNLTVTHPIAVLWQLFRSPLWIGGSTIGLTAWFLHALALNLGTLSLVQPIILLGVVLAVVVRSGLERVAPSRRELTGVVVTIAALIAVVSGSDAHAADVQPATVTMVLVAGSGLAVAVVVTRLANELPRRGVAAFVLGMNAGMLFGITACLMKVAGQAVRDHGVPGALATWSPWALALCAFFATSLNQRAYQLSRLSHSMPVLNVTSVLVSILLGAVLFGETLSTEPATLAVQAIGLVGIAWGLFRIADAGTPAAARDRA